MLDVTPVYRLPRRELDEAIPDPIKPPKGLISRCFLRRRLASDSRPEYPAHLRFKAPTSPSLGGALPALSSSEAMGSPACRRRFLGLRVGNVAPLPLRPDADCLETIRAIGSNRR